MSRRKRRAISPETPEVRVLRVIEKPAHNVRWVVEERRHVALARPEWPDALGVRTDRVLVVEALAGTLPTVLPLEAYPRPEELEGLRPFGMLYERRDDRTVRFLPPALWCAGCVPDFGEALLDAVARINDAREHWPHVGGALAPFIERMDALARRLGTTPEVAASTSPANDLHPVAQLARMRELIDRMDRAARRPVEAFEGVIGYGAVVEIVRAAIGLGYVLATLEWLVFFGEDTLEGLRLARGRAASGGRPAEDRDARLAAMRRLIVHCGRSVRAAARWVADNIGGTQAANIKLWQRYHARGQSTADDPDSPRV